MSEARGEAGGKCAGREVLSRLAEVGIVSPAVQCLELGTEVAPPPLGPNPWPREPAGVRYKRRFRLGFAETRPRGGEEKGEHLEGRSRGLGRLGGTSALSRARAPLGAGAGIAQALSSGT